MEWQNLKFIIFRMGREANKQLIFGSPKQNWWFSSFEEPVSESRSVCTPEYLSKS